jgi:hypothetical protein
VQPGQPAQPGQPVGGSNFGTVTLAPGFQPDPHVVAGTSGGSTAAQSVNPLCRGFISQQPDHLLVASGTFANLRVLANGGAGDVTLVVRRPDGSYLCDDDTEGRNPIVQGPFPAGTYQVFVGSYEAGTNIPYNLGISEIGSVTAAQLGSPAGGGGPQPGNMASNFGTVTLAPGFMPDPHVVSGRSGGAVSANTLHPSCSGWVSQTPDHILAASGNFSNFRVLVRASSDTTLVVQRPDGGYLCNDDTEEHNPIVQAAFPTGTYRIWVGSYTQTQDADYQIGFSELASTRARDLR